MTAQEILTRASRALEASAERARARDAEILRQRALSLASLPRTAGAAHAAPQPPKPPVSYEEQERQIADKLAAAERDADAKARAAEDDALDKWRTADADAYAKYTRAVEDARNAYITLVDTLQGAIHTMSGADQARFIRDRAIAAAEAEYRAAKSADYDAYARSSAAAREQAIDTIERARLDADTSRRLLDASQSPAPPVADAIPIGADDAVLAGVLEAFDSQIAQSKTDAAREVARIMSRMRTELAAIGEAV